MRWLLVVVVVALVIAGCAQGQPIAPTAAPTNTPIPPTPTSVPTATSTPTTPPTATSTPIPSSTPTATALPTATPAIGSLSKSVPFGESILYTIPEGNILELSVTKIARGAEALDLVNRNNTILPEKPGKGNEFFTVYVEAKHVTPSEEFQTMPVTYVAGWSVAVNGEMKLPEVVLMMENTLNAELLPGAETGGWITFKVPTDSEVTKLRFSMDAVGRTSIWFDLNPSS